MSLTPDSTLADPQQIIAGLRHQLAMRTAERDDAQRMLKERSAERDEVFEQQTATAEGLQTINNSPGDLAPVFDAMLERRSGFTVAIGGLWTVDRERGRLAAARGRPAEFVVLLREPGESDANPALQRIMRGEQLIARYQRATLHENLYDYD